MNEHREFVNLVNNVTPYQTRLDPPPGDPRVAHQLRDIMKIIVNYFDAIYGGDLVSIAHFGSRPNGTYKADSDYDFFVVLENRASRNELAEKSQVMDFAEIRELPLHNHVVKKCELYAPANFMILLDIKNTGIILYDKDSFLAKEIQKLPNIPLRKQ